MFQQHRHRFGIDLRVPIEDGNAIVQRPVALGINHPVVGVMLQQISDHVDLAFNDGEVEYVAVGCTSLS
jgi:hypothetical protein